MCAFCALFSSNHILQQFTASRQAILDVSLIFQDVVVFDFELDFVKDKVWSFIADFAIAKTAKITETLVLSFTHHHGANNNFTVWMQM